MTIRNSFLDFVYQPVKDASDNVTSIFVEGSNVTERHAAEVALRASEASLRELNRDLERRAIERIVFSQSPAANRLIPDPSNDINRLVAGMEDLLHRTLGVQVEFHSSLAAQLWTAFHANQLANAILNLAINAREAMMVGGKLTIVTANTRLNETYASTWGPRASYAAIHVSDTGVGTSLDVLAEVVDPFFTTNPAGI